MLEFWIKQRCPYGATRYIGRTKQAYAGSMVAAPFPTTRAKRFVKIVRFIVFLGAVLGFSFPTTRAAEAVDPRNANHLALEAALQTVCAGINNLATPTAAQTQLTDACATLQSVEGDGVTINQDRLVPEEAFHLVDLVVDGHDLRLSNLLMRMQAFRARTSGKRQVVPQQEPETGVGVFANYRFSYSRYDTTGLQKGADVLTAALTVGAEFALNEDVLLGGAIDFARHDTELFPGESDAITSGGNLSLFGSWRHDKLGYADLVFDLGYKSYSLQRKINLFDQKRQFASAKTRSIALSVDATYGKDFILAGFDVGPYGRVSLINGEVDGYSETPTETAGGTGALLNVSSQTIESAKIAIGGQVSRSFKPRRSRLVPQFRLEMD